MATKNKLEIINKFDKYQVWWIDHISHNQWKSMSEAKKENEEAKAELNKMTSDSFIIKR